MNISMSSHSGDCAIDKPSEVIDATEASPASMRKMNLSMSTERDHSVEETSEDNDVCDIVVAPPVAKRRVILSLCSSSGGVGGSIGGPLDENDTSEMTTLSPASMLNPNNGNVLTSVLHDDMVEKIFARLPLKSIFQSLVLSKRWSNLLCPLFQKEAMRHSTQASESYTPLFIGWNMEMLGYGTVSKRWHRLPTLTYLPVLPVVWNVHPSRGSLLCLGTTRMIDNGVWEEVVYVSNPVTKSWKMLPALRLETFSRLVHLVCEGSKFYKVIVMSKSSPNGNQSLCVHVFESVSDSWSVRYHIMDSWYLHPWSSSVYLNGVVYMLDGTKLLGYNVDRDILIDVLGSDRRKITLVGRWRASREERLRRRRVAISWGRNPKLVVCGSDLMVVNFESDDAEFSFWVLKVDLETLSCNSLPKVSNAARQGLSTQFDTVTGHGEFIYMGNSSGRSSESMVYNIRTHECAWVPPYERIFNANLPRSKGRWGLITYQPSFMQV